MSRLLASVGARLAFGEPASLPLALGAALGFLLALIALALIARRRPAVTYGSSYPRVGRVKLWFAAAGAAALAITAAAEPQLVIGGAGFGRGQVDVTIAVDVSSSMWIRDLGPSRLELAVREVLDLQGEGIFQTGDRAELLVFGGTTVRKALLSPNIDRLMEAAERLAPPAILTGDGLPWDSDVAGLLEHLYLALDAQDRLERGGRPDSGKPRRRSDRPVILLTDGDFAPDPDQLASLDRVLAELRLRGLAVYPIGIGDGAGATPLASVLQAYVAGSDYDDALEAELAGQQVRVNAPLLSRIAQRTGGRAFTLRSEGGSAAAFLRGVVDDHRSISTQMVSRERTQDVWRYLTMAAILLLALGILFY